ncbi:MAG: DNA/RNA non-specific endonuclease [Cytophagaceae bacterium]|nr:DNA/RNA non-specific endonuclease [Cytophagaceae bacterium]
MDKLKQFVRTRGADYLRDHNISSVGIGYKQTGGKATRELSIQFTVGEKVVPELLEVLGTEEIPSSFIIDGVEVPTDVIQRKFEPEFRVVSEAATPARKNRIDPVVPGVSVANRTVSAGTIGCMVYDRVDGTPYILSNWHVLHGPLGRIGDEIVQPGPHDDNRVQLNYFGKLIRSHLGPAGDCAIASIEGRGFNPEILELGVKVEQLGEAELGDKVIKSGRTTAVTHGIVTRIHTIAKINYGAIVGEKLIGGFEIGPDENHPPENEEISMGGDSGSAWLFKSINGRPSNVMAGLHFAGEGPENPNEHAVACYARSVFEKLEIVLVPPPQPDPGQTQGRGYRLNFLGILVNLPKLGPAIRNDAFRLSSSEVIPYTHFSLAMSKSRRFASWVAWNIDGGNIKRVSRNGIPFVVDPRLPTAVQVGNDLYSGNRLDRGHIARRADLVWGTDAEARQANRDSFFFTNITPQMDNFNQGSLGGIWGKLEDAVFEEVDVDNLKVSVFGGPVFRSDDRVFRGVKIPREFYKIIAFMEGGALKSKAFLLTQNLDQLEVLDLNQFRVFQVTLVEVEQRTSLIFPNTLKAADAFAEQLETASEALSDRKPLDSLDEIKW